MVVPNTIEIPAQPDLYAATRIVSLIPGDGTDLTIASAVAALPAEGGTIFIKQGVYPHAAPIVLPDKSIRFVGAGSAFDGVPSTTIDLGANLITAFERPFKKHYRFEHLNVLGTGVVGQAFIDNQVGTDAYIDCEDVKVQDIQTCFLNNNPHPVRLTQFEHHPSLGAAAQFWTTTSSGSYIYADQVKVIGATIEGNPFLYATNSTFYLTQSAGPFVNLIREMRVSECEFAGEILALSSFNTITGCVFTNGIFGTPPARYLDFPNGINSITGCLFLVDASVEDIRIASIAGQATVISGCVFYSVVPGTRRINVTVPGGAIISGCDFHGSTSEQILINATSIDVTITGCDFEDDATAARAIDILSGAFRITIVSCNFKFFSTEAIQIAGARVMVVGCTGCKVVETAAANINRYSNNDGFDPSTISVTGNASLIENENVRETGVDTLIDEFTRTVLVDASGANRTITLPTAASSKWRKYDIKKIDATVNTVTVDADGAETIDGALTFVLSIQYESVTIQSDGTEWWVL